MREFWNKLEESSDLFDYWHKELEIRHQFRKEYNINYFVKLENREQIDFLYRSLYLVNQQDSFFTLIIPSLNKAFALNWIKTAPPHLIINFLEFLPMYILRLNPEIEKLLFLVHIYHTEFDPYFTTIINLFTNEECQYLINKTANQDLRKLIRARQKNIELEQKDILYNIELNSSLSTLHGDKSQLLAQAINNLHNNFTTNTYAYFSHLLTTIEQVFAIGLVNDALLLLLSTYEDYQLNNKITDLTIDEKIMKAFNKQARRILPMYAILYQPEAFNFSYNFYNQSFPKLTPDISSLIYLKIYEKIASISVDFPSAILDIIPELTQIRQLRPDETPLLYEYELTEKITPKRFYEILKLAESKLISLPHEAFITLEFLRNLLKYNYVLEVIDKDILAKDYLILFRWLPSSLFINNNIVTDLSTHTSHKIREELDKIIKLTTYYDTNSLFADINEKPDLIKNDDIRKLILTGKFMGVL